MAVTLSTPSYIGGTQATLNGAGQNVPAGNTMRFDLALDKGGPWTAHSSPEYVSTVKPTQPVTYYVPLNTLTPETEYSVRLVELNPADAIVNTSNIVSFETIVLDSGPIALQCLAPCTPNVATPFPWVLPPCPPPCDDGVSPA
jgi:hypothetical protein